MTVPYAYTNSCIAVSNHVALKPLFYFHLFHILRCSVFEYAFYIKHKELFCKNIPLVLLNRMVFFFSHHLLNRLETANQCNHA